MKTKGFNAHLDDGLLALQDMLYQSPAFRDLRRIYTERDEKILEFLISGAMPRDLCIIESPVVISHDPMPMNYAYREWRIT